MASFQDREAGAVVHLRPFGLQLAGKNGLGLDYIQVSDQVPVIPDVLDVRA